MIEYESVCLHTRMTSQNVSTGPTDLGRLSLTQSLVKFITTNVNVTISQTVPRYRAHALVR